MGPAVYQKGAAITVTSASVRPAHGKALAEAGSEEKRADEVEEESKHEQRADGAAALFVRSVPGYNKASTSEANYVGAHQTVLEHRARHAAEVEARASLEAAGEAPPAFKLNKNYHYIHGKAYDLRPFYSKHPGGADILLMSAGLVDATPAFESYHAMANMPSILKQMEAYRVADEDHDGPLPPAMYSFDKDGFWYTLRKRVRAHFGTDKEAASVTRQSKADWVWWAKFALFSGLWAVTYAVALTQVLGDAGRLARIVAAALSGMFFIQWGFNSMHDASHFAVGARNHWLNQWVTSLWCGLALWNSTVWSYHHAVLHHSFTGNERLDPDIHHAMPLVRKHPETGKSPLDFVFQGLGDNFGMAGWGLACVVIYVLAPGMWGGQVAMYALYRLALTKGSSEMWGMKPLATVRGYRTPWFEHILYFSQVVVHLYHGDLLVTYAYVVSLNFFYSMCIVADHDLLESALTNHLDVPAPQDQLSTDGPLRDWGEVQVRNSTDFVHDKSGGFDWFAFCFGSINAQVAHHSFPGIVSCALPGLSPIIAETCEEFGIPYSCQESLYDAWVSFLLTVRAVMTKKPLDEEIQQLRAAQQHKPQDDKLKAQ